MVFVCVFVRVCHVIGAGTVTGGLVYSRLPCHQRQGGDAVPDTEDVRDKETVAGRVPGRVPGQREGRGTACHPPSPGVTHTTRYRL